MPELLVWPDHLDSHTWKLQVEQQPANKITGLDPRVYWLLLDLSSRAAMVRITS